jgi:phosphoglucomutase
MDNTLITNVMLKAQQWLDGAYDENTKAEIRHLMENNQKELIECFYTDLEFGTGGLRGIMGVGTNRVNIYTVAMATQGLSNYLIKNFPGKKLSAAIAYDCRNNGQLFAQKTAEVFAANGIKVYLFDSLRPTPELSFAIRHFACQTGVVVTASHNPKEYNGYKVYWEDGAQIIAPHDKNIIAEVRKISSISDVKQKASEGMIHSIGNEVDAVYLNRLETVVKGKEYISKVADMKIVYTPIHGTGVELVPAILKQIGFNNIYGVDAQNVVDGNFPTVQSPNPENADALQMAIDKAMEVDADLVMATDPDADRVGIAIKVNNQFLLLNGNQTGAILSYYMLNTWKEQNLLQGKEYMVKTIVTTELIAEMAKAFHVEYYDVLTGFKYIAGIMRQNEGKKTFIFGGEESYGYLAGDFVRDKDAVMACALIAETAAWAKNQNKSLWDILMEIYAKYGYFQEDLVNVVKKGKEGAEEISRMMQNFRDNTPAKIGGSDVVMIKDYLNSETINLKENRRENISLPKENVLQFITEDFTKISVRPSGTEPKIKFYVSVKIDLAKAENFEAAQKCAREKILLVKSDLAI